MENDKKCAQCGAKENLIQLLSGKYGCMDCLSKLGKEQNQIRTDIIDYLEADYNITNPIHQANCLKAIAQTILYENNLLDKNEIEKINETYKNMFGEELKK